MIMIDIFYTNGCEGYTPAFDNLNSVLEKAGVKCRLEVHTLVNDNDAEKWKVIGSPSIHVNGKDVEKDVRDSEDYSVKCRTYREGAKTLNAPSKMMILKAIDEELPDPMICYCKGVTRSKILSALKQGAKTFKDIQKLTGASTGNECETKNPTGKCCSPFVLEIIKVEQPAQLESCCQRSQNPI